jgi:hypothetical protein
MEIFNKKTWTLLVTIYLIIFLGCKVSYVPMNKKPYDGNEFRLDGYYYNRFQYGTSEPLLLINFFYSDGTVLFWGNTKYDSSKIEMTLLRLEKLFKMEKRNGTIYPDHYNWSSFEVNGKEINMKSWAMSENFKKGTYETSLTIINDSLLLDSDSSEPSYLYFSKFNAKPSNDSCPIN